jgi:integrase
MYALAAMTGLRAGEILGLRLEDVDFERQTLRVAQTLWCGQVQSAKTPGSEDVLPLPGPLATILHEHLRKWKGNPGQLLFVNQHGRPFVAEKVVARHLGPLLAKLNIPHGGFHAFRHGHSSLLIDGGASVKVAQEQLRHTDPRMTLDRYTHVIGDTRRAAVEKLASILDPNGPELEKPGKYIQ